MYISLTGVKFCPFKFQRWKREREVCFGSRQGEEETTQDGGGFFFFFFFLGFGYFIVHVPNKLGFSQVDQISSFAFSQVDIVEITSSAAEDINHS